jgi:hypothetical protein
VDGEPHWAIIRRIEDLRSQQQTAIRKKAAAILLDLEDLLPLEKIETIEREIATTSVRRTCQGILMMASALSEHCGPAPAGWPGCPNGDGDVLLDDSVISAAEEEVAELQREAEVAALQREADQALEKAKASKKQPEGQAKLEPEQPQGERAEANISTVQVEMATQNQQASSIQRGPKKHKYTQFILDRWEKGEHNREVIYRRFVTDALPASERRTDAEARALFNQWWQNAAKHRPEMWKQSRVEASARTLT